MPQERSGGRFIKKEDVMETTLYLVRHGTTEWNVRCWFQGVSDVPLNELGMAQGELLTDYFSDIPIDLGVTSPLIRARQTLEFMLGSRKERIPVLTEPGIQEINLGVLEGRSVRESSVLFPEFMENFRHCPGKAAAPRRRKRGTGL